MRYRLDVVSPCVADVVTFAGGWLVDRVMAGWDVTVLIDGAQDVRALEILGVQTADLQDALEMWADRPHPQTVAVASELFATNARIREGVLNALDHGLTEVTLWGEHCPAELDSTVGWVRHQLSAAARAFKARALEAIEPPVGASATIGDAEIFRCGMMTRPSVAADLIPAS